MSTRLSTISVPSQQRRYPFPFPYGWFVIGYSDELARGAIKGIRYFDREMVVWRDEAGEAHCMDAICPHLGAHFAHGGTVEGRCIRCPYHGWKYDSDGSLCEVPFATAPKRSVSVATYPLIERNDFLLMWYHPAGEPPEWDIPEIAQYHDASYRGPVRPQWTIRTCWQEMTENEADLTHFGLTHQEAYPAFMDKFEADGPFLRVLRLHWHRSPVGVMPVEIEQDNYGPGFVVTKFRSTQVTTCLVSGITPIDHDNVHVQFGLKVHRFRLRDRILAPLLTRKSMLTLVKESALRQLDEDIGVWENKAYYERPPLAPEYDRFIPRLRKWCHQFYQPTNGTKEASQ
jgi:3-ketosteroid 9alpha-monooxygenase subunit A